MNYVAITQQPNPREEAVILQVQLRFFLAQVVQVPGSMPRRTLMPNTVLKLRSKLSSMKRW
jgi:hypothetical protein